MNDNLGNGVLRSGLRRRVIPRKCPFKTLTKSARRIRGKSSDSETYVLHQQFKANDKKPPIGVNHRRNHLNFINCYFESEFKIATNLTIKVCLICEDPQQLQNRVVVMFTTGWYQICVPAFKFIEEGLETINEGFEGGMEHEEECEEENFCDVQEISVEFYKDSHCSWVVFKRIEGRQIMDVIHISSLSWMKVIEIMPLLKQCVDHYTDTLLKVTSVSKLVRVDTFNSRVANSMIIW